MMKTWIITIAMMFAWINVSFAQVIVSGVVKDKESRRELSNVAISVVGSNVGTVTNADGEFTLKLSEEDADKGLLVSHIGYTNIRLSQVEMQSG
jgi:hypothetical protein